jgi:acyl-CoA synthetase (AMP-forming)/AMP-acid ligase II
VTETVLRTTPDDLRARYLAEGLWNDQSLGQYLDAQVSRSAGKTLRVWSHDRPWQGTIGDAQQLGRRMAGGLRELGIDQGDVVAFQLPNCPEAVATFFAVTRLGATLVPIVHFYGPKETEYILRESGAKVLITADAFGWLDYRANLEQIRPNLPDLAQVVTVPMREPAPQLGELATAEPLADLPDVDPDAPALIAYTSGTTADPKGVIHTHRSIVAEGNQLGMIQPTVGHRPLLNGAPLGHAIGMLGGILVPLYLGHEMHLTDGWDPQLVLDGMLEADIYSGSGATFFLQSLLDHPALTDEHLAKMRYVGLGGASVPVSFSQRATDLGISIMRSYGSTEHPSTTGASHDEPVEKRIATDGHPLAGVELRIVDEEGADVRPGEPGEIWSRGPDLCAGYTDTVLTAETFTDDGWYRSGDIGIVDEDGWLTITDRKKDIIIRGGETISPVEVEDVLLRMPGVAEVAVVAAPDERLGEHGCAFVRAADPGAPPDLAAVRSHLEQLGLAKQKWPEELRIVDDFPRTPSGKVKKFELRQQLG